MKGKLINKVTNKLRESMSAPGDFGEEAGLLSRRISDRSSAAAANFEFFPHMDLAKLQNAPEPRFLPMGASQQLSSGFAAKIQRNNPNILS